MTRMALQLAKNKHDAYQNSGVLCDHRCCRNALDSHAKDDNK